jgi:hypothetical protein
LTTYNLKDFLARSYNDTNKTELLLLLPQLPFSLCMKEGPWVAGGAVRRTLLGEGIGQSDIDLFFKDVVQKATVEQKLEAAGAKQVKKGKHNTEYTLKIEDAEYRIQLITIGYYDTAEAVIDSFDFTICQFITDGETFGAAEHSLWDLVRKRLVVHKITYAVASMRRVLKYTKQGFYACSGMLTSFLTIVGEDKTLLKQEVEYID